jgi:hypothetical protein
MPAERKKFNFYSPLSLPLLLQHIHSPLTTKIKKELEQESFRASSLASSFKRRERANNFLPPATFDHTKNRFNGNRSSSSSEKFMAFPHVTFSAPLQISLY